MMTFDDVSWGGGVNIVRGAGPRPRASGEKTHRDEAEDAEARDRRDVGDGAFEPLEESAHQSLPSRAISRGSEPMRAGTVSLDAQAPEKFPRAARDGADFRQHA